MIVSSVILITLVAVVVGGFLKGLAGFGFGLVATTLLAQFIPPHQAVAVLILPVLGANSEAIREMKASALRSCVFRFKFYLTAVIIGTVLGIRFIAFLPSEVLSVAIGVFALGFVFVRQDLFNLSFSNNITRLCYRTHVLSQLGVGTVSGAVFGGTNNGALIISYLDSLDLERQTFVGLVSLTAITATIVRLWQGTSSNLFTPTAPLWLSAVAVIPALFAVLIGSLFRDRIAEKWVELTVLSLLFVIGLKLVLTPFLL